MKKILLFIAIFFVACSNDPAPNSAAGERKLAIENELNVDLGKAKEKKDLIKNQNKVGKISTPEELVKTWNEALNNGNTEILANLYADEIYYYSTKMNRANILEKKKKYLSEHPDFKQQISDIFTKKVYDQTTEIDFNKSFTANGKSQQTVGTLTARKKGDTWVIVEETDAATRKKNVGEITNCREVWMAIFKSAKEKDEKSNTMRSPYETLGVAKDEISLFTSFDETENAVYYEIRDNDDDSAVASLIGSYIFDVKEQKLYNSFSSDEGKGTVIEFDKNLLKDLSKFCK